MQKWIDDSLSKKLLVRETVFYLGTAYESTRVRDTRQDNILREQPKKEEVEFVYIHPDLLSDQKRLIDILQKSRVSPKVVESQLKRYFAQVDKESIGVITQPQFLVLIKNIGIKLTPLEEKEVLKRVDPQESGMVEYGLYQTVIGEFIEGIEAKKEALSRLATTEEEEVFGSILMLVNDEAQDIEDTLIQKFKAKDQDETGLTNISEVKTVLDEIIKKYKEENKPQPLSIVELAEVTKILTDTYGYKEIPYAKIHKHMIEHKIKQLSSGRINSRMNNLQVHLRELFDKHDEKKLGKIKIEHFEEALKKSEKIKLTKAQLYLLKSFLVVDVKGEINYIDNSKFLAELIKKFYLNSNKRKE